MKKFIMLLSLAGMVLVASACLEDLFSSDDDEELNQALAGVWYRFSVTEDGISSGLPALVELRNDGTGTIQSIDEPEQDEPASDTFKWLTEGEMITINDENDSLIWSGTFTLSDDNQVLHFSYTSEGRPVEQKYVKYTGEKNPQLIGTWIMVDLVSGGEEPLILEKVVFTQSGGTDYYIDDLNDIEGEITTEHLNVTPFSWTTTGNYLLVFDDTEELPFVIGYTLTGDELNGYNYTDDGQREDFILVKETGNIDQNGVGNWELASMKINGMTNPISGIEIALSLASDGSGVWNIVTFSQSYNFNWTTNNGYVFIYRAELPLIAWVQKYEITGDSMVLETDTEYYEGYGGWVNVEYTFTRSQ